MTNKPDEKKTLREIVACAVAAGVNTDVIAALAFADRLGSALWRLKYANDAGSYQPALQLVVKRMLRAKPEGRGLTTRIAERALHEYLDENCNYCGGRGMIYAMERAVHSCTHCDGTGRKRHQNFERALAVGVPIERYPKFASRFERAAEIISNADQFAAKDIARQLSNRAA